MDAVALRPFKYAGQPLDRGEVFTLKSTPRDAKLEYVRYIARFDPAVHARKPCDTCGRKFATESALHGHRVKPDCLAETQEIEAKEISEMVGHDVKVVD